MESDFIVVFCTVPDGDEGAKIGRALVEEKLAACVNIVGGLRSIYHWDGEVCDDPEALLVIKSRRASFDALERRIIELHSNEVAEIIAVPIVAGHQPYLQWIDESLDRE